MNFDNNNEYVKIRIHKNDVLLTSVSEKRDNIIQIKDGDTYVRKDSLSLVGDFLHEIEADFSLDYGLYSISVSKKEVSFVTDKLSVQICKFEDMENSKISFEEIIFPVVAEVEYLLQDIPKEEKADVLNDYVMEVSEPLEEIEPEEDFVL